MMVRYKFWLLVAITLILVGPRTAHSESNDSSPQPKFREVTCEGSYAGHLQGICVDDDSIYWSFTTSLVRTDLAGKLIKKIPVVTHHGDLCIDDGKLYVAVNLGKFNDPAGNADSWIYVYDAKSLTELSRHEIQQVFHGAGGIGIEGDHFFVVGGLPADVQENYVYQYDRDLNFIKKHSIQSGQTRLGIQTATFAYDRWWFGCYGTPKILLVTDRQFEMIGRYEFDCSLGIVGIGDDRFLSALGSRNDQKLHSGHVKLAVPDSEVGLRYE